MIRLLENDELVNFGVNSFGERYAIDLCTAIKILFFEGISGYNIMCYDEITQNDIRRLLADDEIEAKRIDLIKSTKATDVEKKFFKISLGEYLRKNGSPV